MLKIATGVFVAAFVGTLAYEVVKRKKPELLLEVGSKASSAARNFVDGFREGYRSAAPEAESRPSSQLA
jgi:hypothetical protein